MSEPVLLLPVGRDAYALPLAWAHEVVAAPVVTPLVTAPPVVLGLFNLRGQIVPLLDTASLLGLGAVESADFAVVVATASGLVGLATTGIPRREVLADPAGASELHGTRGLFRFGDQVAALLDPEILLDPEQFRGTRGPGLEPTGRDA